MTGQRGAPSAEASSHQPHSPALRFNLFPPGCRLEHQAGSQAERALEAHRWAAGGTPELGRPARSGGLWQRSRMHVRRRRRRPSPLEHPCPFQKREHTATGRCKRTAALWESNSWSVVRKWRVGLRRQIGSQLRECGHSSRQPRDRCLAGSQAALGGGAHGAQSVRALRHP